MTMDYDPAKPGADQTVYVPVEPKPVKPWWPLRLPHWFPELDAKLYLNPLCDIQLSALRRCYNVRWYGIGSVQIRLFAWKNVWKIDTGFDLYWREER